MKSSAPLLWLGAVACAHGTLPPERPGPEATVLAQDETDRLAGFAIGIAYSGYRRGQHPNRGQGSAPPSEEELLEDLKILTSRGTFGLIRLYDSGDISERVLTLIRQHEIPLKVMLGVWLNAEVSNHEGCPWLTEPIPEAKLADNRRKNGQEVARAIQLAKRYGEIIVAVNVGNEALVDWSDHLVSLPSMIDYLRQVRRTIDQPVTTADNYVPWTTHGPELADEVDFAAVHTYPAWEQRDIDAALPFTIENLEAVRKAVGRLPLVIAEAGWPSVASEFGERASQENQRRYYRELTDWAAKNHITTLVFEAFDETWKGNPNDPDGAEKHWGLFTIDRKPKLVMQERFPELRPADPHE